jgi:SAM-dependent methyltransferase
MSDISRDTDNDWKLVAERDPFWGVLSEDGFRRDAMDAAAHARFMQTGEEYVANHFGLVRHHLDPDFKPRRALDVGCGVGRLLLPMARRVDEAVGVDIAPAMLELAARHADQAGVRNAELLPSDDSLSRVKGQFDFVNCYIVLQHIPPERGYRLIQSMLSRLAVGGVGSLQVTYAKARKFLEHEAPKASFYRREGGVLIDIMSVGWQPEAGTITMYDYDLNQVTALVASVAGHPMLVLPTFDDSHLGVHYVFRRAR